MKLFNPDNHTLSSRNKNIYAYHELAYTFVDFLAATLFVVGSILFFKEQTTYAGTWLFLIGSIFFGLRPTIKIFREIFYFYGKKYHDIADG